MGTGGGEEASNKDGKSEDSFLLGCYSVPLGNNFSAFRTVVVTPSSCSSSSRRVVITKDGRNTIPR